MKILMVTDFFAPFVGGVEVLVQNLSVELAQRGHEVAVATLAAPDLPSSELVEGVRIHRVRTAVQRVSRLFATPTRPWAPPAPDPLAVRELRRVLRDVRPDVVHGHDWLARSLLPLKRPRRAPALVMSLHYYTLSCPKKSLMRDGSPCSGPRFGKCLGCAGRHYGRSKGAAVVLGQFAFSRQEAAVVDLFLPVSEAAAAGSGLPGRLPYRVVPNLVPVAPGAGPDGPLLNALPAEPFLLFVGDLRWEKGIHVLLEAYRRLRERPPLVIIGKVWSESPRLFPPGVLVLREWPNRAVREAMSRCLALVAPSVLPEPFGIVVAEALASGRPVVASSIGGIPEIARDGREALLVPPGEVAPLAAALERVIRDRNLRRRLAANALTRAADYSPAVVVPQLEAAYAGAVAATTTPFAERR